MKGRILQLNTSIPLKCGTGCVIIKLKLGRVGMQGRIQTLVFRGGGGGGPNFGEGSRGPPRPLLIQGNALVGGSEAKRFSAF